MSDDIRIVGIAGSLRDASWNGLLLDRAAVIAPDGVTIERWHGLKAVPPFDEDDEGLAVPEAVADLRDHLAAADALLIVTPEYNSSIPGQLKNAIDWLSRPAGGDVIRNLPAAAIGASTGTFGGIWAQGELRKVLGALGARVVDVEMPLPYAHEAFADDGTLIDPDHEAGVANAVVRLVDAVRLRRERLATIGQRV